MRSPKIFIRPARLASPDPKNCFAIYHLPRPIVSGTVGQFFHHL
jgi:hypothetical protein